MKRNLMALLLVLIGGAVTAQSSVNRASKYHTNLSSPVVLNPVRNEFDDVFGKIARAGEINRNSTIDAFDTVIFNLSQAIVTGNYVQFPVSISTDDSIFSLDFSLKYNHSNLIYDTIFDLTNYLQIFSFYNVSDSTIRFTSNSLQAYSGDTPLVSIRFVMLSAQISSSDLNSIHAYPNGSPCSVKVIDVLPNSVGNIDENNLTKIYPNPVNEKLRIEITEKSTAQLFNIEGRQFLQADLNAGQNEIDTRNIANGIYIMRINHNDEMQIRKIVVGR